MQCICGAESGPFCPRREDEPWGTQEEAIAAWNRRTPPHAAGGEPVDMQYLPVYQSRDQYGAWRDCRDVYEKVYLSEKGRDTRTLYSKAAPAQPAGGGAELGEDWRKLHGHVTARPDGAKARCGGPPMCRVCKAELDATNRQEKPNDPS